MWYAGGAITSCDVVIGGGHAGCAVCACTSSQSRPGASCDCISGVWTSCADEIHGDCTLEARHTSIIGLHRGLAVATIFPFCSHLFAVVYFDIVQPRTLVARKNLTASPVFSSFFAGASSAFLTRAFRLTSSRSKNYAADRRQHFLPRPCAGTSAIALAYPIDRNVLQFSSLSLRRAH